MADKVGAGAGLKGSTQQCPITVLIKHRRGTRHFQSCGLGWGRDWRNSGMSCSDVLSGAGLKPSLAILPAESTTTGSH